MNDKNEKIKYHRVPNTNLMLPEGVEFYDGPFSDKPSYEPINVLSRFPPEDDEWPENIENS